MTLDQITILNFDDYIRQEKRKGNRKITWNRKGWNILKLFTKKDTQGMYYLGAKHFKI